MNRYLLFAIALLISTNLFSQNKLVLKNGWKRRVLKVGHTLGVTKKGEDIKFERWKRICSGCKDSICRKNIWRLDSIQYNYIVLRQNIPHDSAYIYDTVLMSDKKNAEYSKKWEWVGEIETPDSIYENYPQIYRLPILFNRKRIPLDSIESFTFSKRLHCNGFTLAYPLMGLTMIIVGPFASVDNGVFSPLAFTVFETMGFGICYSVYKSIKNHKIYTYDTKKWTATIK